MNFMKSVINIFFHVDDHCLLAPSAVALQMLLDICQRFRVEYDITFNPLESIYIVIIVIALTSSAHVCILEVTKLHPMRG